jgi:hypothetical protein
MRPFIQMVDENQKVLGYMHAGERWTDHAANYHISFLGATGLVIRVNGYTHESQPIFIFSRQATNEILTQCFAGDPWSVLSQHKCGLYSEGLDYIIQEKELFYSRDGLDETSIADFHRGDFPAGTFFFRINILPEDTYVLSLVFCDNEIKSDEAKCQIYMRKPPQEFVWQEPEIASTP